MTARSLSLAVLLTAALPAAAQEAPTPSAVPLTETAQREVQTAQDMLARAQAEFEGAQQSRAIPLLDEIVSRLEELRRQGTLSAPGRDVLVQAYELRARSYFNIGLQEKAGDSFRSLLQVRPQHTLSKERVSPKIVDYFNGVKKGMVGFLAVSSKPPGARVTLNGEFLSLTDFFPLDVLAGTYTVEITRDGYKPETRQVTIAPRGTETVQVELARTAASAYVITQPAGVEVWVDGALRATSAGTLSPEFADAATAKGLDPARASARMEIGNLSIGAHVLEFKKRCYETVKRSIEAPEARDYEAEPVLLEESLASLHLDSDPPGARIFIDNEAMGVTPKDLEGLCAGPHRVEVKHTAGRFIQDIVLAKNDALSLDAPIRPSVAFLGVFAEGGSAERRAADVTEMVRKRLSAIRTLNVVPAPRDLVDPVLLAEHLTPASLMRAGADADVVRRVTEKLAAALEVQGFVVAVLPDEKIQRAAEIDLLAAGNTVPDRFDVSLTDSAGFERLMAAVDRKASLSRAWAGLITVDTLLHDGVPVLRTAPLSPAAVAAIQPGDLIVGVDGHPVKQTADILAALAARKPKDHLALQVKGASGTRAVDLVLGETAQEIPLNDPAILYNKAMMDLRQQVEGYPGTEAAALARLNLAIASMHFADFAAAHEHLLKARTELPQRPGISQGTAIYYLARPGAARVRQGSGRGLSHGGGPEGRHPFQQ
jgi:membrane-associated protease RseP (regulator of RpoE activity)